MPLHSFLSSCTANIKNSTVSEKEVAVYLAVGTNTMEAEILTFLPTAKILTPTAIII